MTRDYRIVPVASAADLADAIALLDAYVASLGIDLAFQDLAGERAAMPGAYAPPAGALLLARDRQGLALGCVALRPIPPDGTCEMKRLFVLPVARGLSLGRALVEAVLEAAVRIGYREMRLDTLPGMAGAIAIYRSAGFSPIAPYYDTPVAGTIFLGRLLPAAPGPADDARSAIID